MWLQYGKRCNWGKAEKKIEKSIILAVGRDDPGAGTVR